VLTDNEEKELMTYFKNDIDMLHYFTILIDTGMRAGEALQLAPKYINLETQEIELRNDVDMKLKSFTPRNIPMTTRVYAILKQRTGDKTFSFTQTRVNRQWNKFRAFLGHKHDPDFVVHSLRHTCATRLLSRGVQIYTVKEWLGHASVTTTERYLELSKQALKDAAKVLETSVKPSVIHKATDMRFSVA
jgi:integrase